MRKFRVVLVALLMGATAIFVGSATPASATTCSEPGQVDCTIWESPICNEAVPKRVRAAAGCFDIQP